MQIVKDVFYIQHLDVPDTTQHARKRLTTTRAAPILPSNNLSIFSAAPFTTKYSPKPDYLVGAEVFFEDKPLISATLKTSTQTRHAIVLDKFISLTVAHETALLSLDKRIVIYT